MVLTSSYAEKREKVTPHVYKRQESLCHTIRQDTSVFHLSMTGQIRSCLHQSCVQIHMRKLFQAEALLKNCVNLTDIALHTAQYGLEHHFNCQLFFFP